MDKRYIYMLLRKASIKRDNKEDINLLIKETGLNYRTIKGLIKIVDYEESLQKEEINNWLNPDYYTKENMKRLYKDSRLSSLIPFYFYEDAEFVKECKITELPRSFLEGNENIKTFIIVPGIKTISARAFKDCKNLMAVYYAENIENIEDEAFMGCDSLTSVWLPDSVKEIGNKAYKKCISLEEAYIPKNIYTIKKETFRDCIRLKRVLVESKKIEIQKEAFKDCNSLVSITSKRNKNKNTIIKNVGKEAFNGCSSLKEIELESVEIEKRAFLQCQSLEQIIINKYPLKIHQDAFNGCRNIKILKDASLNNIDFMTIEGKEELFPLSINT